MRVARVRKSGVLTFITAAALTTLVGASFAAGPDIPRGPSIDFCPTTEQIEAHLEEYGFDYKPTVACGEDGQEFTGTTQAGEAEVSEAARFEQERERLLTAKRGPDVDGDPRTIEIIYSDGTEAGIIVQTDNPEYWDKLTPKELAEHLYG
jgi:hypothetical protein